MDYSEIPNWWPVCYNACTRAAECLRHQACEQMPKDMTRWAAVMPSALKDGECQYFQKAERVRMARGLNAIYDHVHSASARHNIRMTLTRHFGSKGSYYRFKDGLRWLNPSQQQFIRDVVRQSGGEGEVNFDEYKDDYDFTQLP